jgi:hypothetical protein
MVLWGKGHAAALQVSNNAQWVIPVDQIVTTDLAKSRQLGGFLEFCISVTEILRLTKPSTRRVAAEVITFYSRTLGDMIGFNCAITGRYMAFQ